MPKSFVPQMNTVLVMILIDHIYFFACQLEQIIDDAAFGKYVFIFQDDVVSVLEHYNIALLCKFLDRQQVTF